jgi:1-acylglycerone phosphate reductase
MSASKRTVLITGCSDGGLGSALAIAFHNAGLHVIATARTPSKMASLSAIEGIELLQLDVLSSESISNCVNVVNHLDILVNNAGAGYNMPVSDLSITEAKKVFDLNVWACIELTQALLPLLIKSKGMIVNQTSIASVTTLPFQAAYNASKAAMAMVSDGLRLELAPFGINVVDLKTGLVQSTMIENMKKGNLSTLPANSIYQPAKEVVESTLNSDAYEGGGWTSEQWAKAVTANLLKKSPPPVIWKGESAWLARLGTILPHGALDGTVKKLYKLDVIEEKVKNSAEVKRKII